jgi:hypothetical protein
MRAALSSLALLFLFAASAAFAGHRPVTQDDLDYPGTIVIADGHGKVDVRIVFQSAETCWRLASARPGLPNPATDRPTDRHLYITARIEKTKDACEQKHTELQTRLMIEDKPGTISLDILFVDERGVYQRSQRHRIQR